MPTLAQIVNDLRQKSVQIEAQKNYDIGVMAAKDVITPLNEKISDLTKFNFQLAQKINESQLSKPESPTLVVQKSNNRFVYGLIALVGLIIWKGKLLK